MPAFKKAPKIPPKAYHICAFCGNSITEEDEEVTTERIPGVADRHFHLECWKVGNRKRTETEE